MNTRWDPLHQAAVKSACRMWIERLDQRPAGDTRLVALCGSLLMLIDLGYRGGPDDRSVDAVRAAITAAFRELLMRKKCA